MTKPSVLRSRHDDVPSPLQDRQKILRIFNTYGPRMQINDGRVIPNFMRQALRGENLKVYRDGSQTCSFCYVSDEIDGIVRLARSSEHDPVNIGNPTEFTVLECARKVIATTGSASTIQLSGPKHRLWKR